MPFHLIPFWKKAPFFRLLVPLSTGIILQWYWPVEPRYAWIALTACSCCIIIFFFFISFFNRYRAGFINGIAISVICLSVGILLVNYKDIRNNKKWLGNFYKNSDALIVTLNEPLVEKIKSYKANATVSYLLHKDSCIPIKGKIILYLKKDSAASLLTYGSTIIFHKKPEEIINSGNPGEFDYKRYCLFQGITHQVYLGTREYEILPGKKTNFLVQFIFHSRGWVLNILRNNIKGDKELGLGEALLIGYKNDLDKELVKSYSNTGVVHVIAISGLHLGLIYVILVQLFKPLQQTRKWKWLSPLFIITGLWLFSLLTGAQPSVLRSALMFSCIVLAGCLARKTSVFNTLACSAFILLCINPFWLWDIGFQLSYTAVFSIVLFMRPIYNLFYFKNRLLDMAWQLNALTLSAQVFTIPLCIYHFHQFPNYFLLTNFVAVPLSSLILIIEIILCVLSFIPAIALFTGKLLSLLIVGLNKYVERVESMPFPVWEGIQISITQAALLFAFTGYLVYWLMERSKNGLWGALATLLIFISLRSYSFIKINQQQSIIIYNIPGKYAIDFVKGREYFFSCDGSVLNDAFTSNFHFKPARTLYRLYPVSKENNIVSRDHCISYRLLRILLLDGSLTYIPANPKQKIDILFIWKNPRISLDQLHHSFIIKQVVMNGTITNREIMRWQKDCDSSGIPFHNLTTKGAFVMNLR